MSPDPMGGHFINPQSLNRYAYVHNNPLSMVDPTGLDCVYTSTDHGDYELVRGDCLSDTDNGVFVNGTVQTDSFTVSSSNGNGDYLSFTYQNADSGSNQIYGADVSAFGPMNGLGVNSGFGFGSPSYAAQVLSQAGHTAQIGVNYSMALTAPNFAVIAGLSGGEAAVGSEGKVSTLLKEYGPKAAQALNNLEETGQYLLQSPDVRQQIIDAIGAALGKDYGPIPANWGGIIGSAVGVVSEFGPETYNEIKAHVPH